MEKQEFRQMMLWNIVVSILTSGLVFFGLSASRVSRSVGSEKATGVFQMPSSVQNEERATIDVVNKAQSAIVAVLVSAPVSPSRAMSPFIQFPFDPTDPFAQPQPVIPNEVTTGTRQIGGGSGFFVTSDGLIATNKHVVSFDAATFAVLTQDGKTYPAKLVATDPTLDLAFLKIDGTGFPTVTLGDSEKLVPGQTVIAIGNALDEFRNTVTKGVVSGLHRRVVAGDGLDSEVIEEAIQTDAAINPGNSGGPLLDLQGNVVGMNTAVSENGQSLGFALPISLVKRDIETYAKSGRIVRPFLGVRYQIVTPDLAKQLHLSVDYGAIVLHGARRSEAAVAEGSPASKAGIVENDIILQVDGERIDEAHSLSLLVGTHAPGDKVTLRVLHEGKERTVDVVLSELK